MGLVILHIQWIMLSNQFTIFVTKHIISPNLKEHIFRITIEMFDESLLSHLRQKQEFKPLQSMKYDPTLQIYVRGAEMIRSFLWKSILFVISLVPILGPLLYNQLSSIKRSFSLVQYYLYNLKNLNREQAMQYKYKHLTSFIYMGMSAGILEMLPIFSVFTMIGNVVGGALWSIEHLAEQDKLYSQQE
ncbi:hypothetical protein, no similarity [Maudiozyma saulgeensis]|uniref:Uncharacterized protein n=1 Tax=Maudiozyma saulgeensis TaxID=1789683 RepID=A0A1X7R2Y9_9SACH|nr:hypothetical protein, no similarity [Kazachstania saulgeensis]